MFYVGQKVVCIDDTPPANPWHRAHPLVKNQIYTILEIGTAKDLHFEVDTSRRLWKSTNFRPLVEDKKTISFTEGAPKDSKQWDNRKQKVKA